MFCRGSVFFCEANDFCGPHPPAELKLRLPGKAAARALSQDGPNPNPQILFLWQFNIHQAWQRAKVCVHVCVCG